MEVEKLPISPDLSNRVSLVLFRLFAKYCYTWSFQRADISQSINIRSSLLNKLLTFKEAPCQRCQHFAITVELSLALASYLKIVEI